MSDSVAENAFTAESVDALARQRKAHVDTRPEVIYVSTVSFCGPGKGECSVVGAFFDGSNMVVIFLDHAPSPGHSSIEEERKFWDTAVRRIREEDLYRDVPIVYIPEYDPGRQTSHAPYYLRDFKDVLTMQEFPERRIGVPISLYIKEDMQYRLNKMLVSGDVIVSRNLASSTSHTPEEALATLYGQMKTYTWIIGGVGHSELITRGYTLVHALMMIPYWSNVFTSAASKKDPFMPYVEFAQQ